MVSESESESERETRRQVQLQGVRKVQYVDDGLKMCS